MLSPRKLTAIDIAFLGRTFVLMEFLFAVCFCPALGAFVLIRSHSVGQIVLGIYLVALGVNYVPMLAYALAIPDREAARAELGDELNDKQAAMSKYRRQSLALLIPLLIPAAAITQRSNRSVHS